MLQMLTCETVAVSAALLYMVAHPDASVDIIHGVQHFAVRKRKTGLRQLVYDYIQQIQSQTNTER